MGYASTLEYVKAAAAAVLHQTGLLPHINAGLCLLCDHESVNLLFVLASCISMSLPLLRPKFFSLCSLSHWLHPQLALWYLLGCHVLQLAREI